MNVTEFRKLKGRKPRKHEEDDLQIACVKLFDLNKKKYGRMKLFHPANGGRRNKIEAARFKKMGVLPGISDLVLLVPACLKFDGRAVFIELKSATGKQSESQKAFQFFCNVSDFDYHIIRSTSEFETVVNSYL